MQALEFLKYTTLFATLAVVGCSDSDDEELGDVSEFPSIGVPDQNSFSISATELSPRGANFDGTVITITARLADQLNNNTTIPDGTQVNFHTEGGSIEPSCVTVDGACSVEWTSQDPRPTAVAPERSNGRASILVWATGSESFTDNNSNGLFDDGDVQISDLSEPFLDRNENGQRDANEEFVDSENGLSNGGVHDAADGLYSGPNCAHSTLCSSEQSILVFDNFTITMSTDTVLIRPVTFNGTEWVDVALANPVVLTGTTTFNFLLTDSNGNPPITGTSISFSATDAGEIIGGSTFDVPETTADVGLVSPYPVTATPLVFTVFVAEDPSLTMAENGTLDISVDIPELGSTSVSIPLVDNP